MSDDVLYEIARTWGREIDDNEDENFGSVVEVTERVQLRARHGALSYVVDDGPEVPCAVKTAEEAIASTPVLNEVQPDQITAITARPEVTQLLPFLLVPTGNWGEYYESRWTDEMDDHLSEETSSALPHDIYRVLYVNESRWRMWHTDVGDRFLPGSEYEIAFESDWAYASLYEVAEMNSGMNRNTLGLVTGAVVAEVDAPDTDGIYPEEGSTTIRLLRWSGEPHAAAQLLADWVMSGPVEFFFYDNNGTEADPKYLIQLFIKAAVSEDHSAVASAEELVESTGYELGFFDRSPATTQFTMSLSVGQEVMDATLDLVAAADPEYRDMILAARNPDSPEAQARDARVVEIHSEYYGAD